MILQTKLTSENYFDVYKIKRFFFKCTYPIPINIIIDSAKPNELFTAKFSAIEADITGT
jgi:predicted DNA-binding helix-hairpin-helix protein